MTEDHFNPIEFKRLSDYLFSSVDEIRVDDESIYRTVINRLYFAAYITIREKLRQYISFSETSEEHGEVSGFLKSNPRLSGAGSRLDKMRLRRNEADYHPEIHCGKEKCKKRFKDFDRLLEKIEREYPSYSGQ